MRKQGIPRPTIRAVRASYLTAFPAYWIAYHRKGSGQLRPRYKHVLEMLEILVVGMGARDAEVLQAAVLFSADKSVLLDGRVKTLATLADRPGLTPRATDGTMLKSGMDTPAASAILHRLSEEPDAIRLCLANEYAWVQCGLSTRAPELVHRDVNDMLLPLAKQANLTEVVELWEPWLKEYRAGRTRD